MLGTRSCSQHLFLILFVKVTLISVSPQEQARDPWWCLAHQLAYFLQGYFWFGFDDQFVMDMPDNEVIREGPNGICQDITAYRLDNILYELWPVTLYPTPFLFCVNAHVCDGLAAEFVLTDSWFYVSQASARGQLDEEHAGLPVEIHITNTGRSTLFDYCFDSGVDLPPVFYDPRI